MPYLHSTGRLWLFYHKQWEQTWRTQAMHPHGQQALVARDYPYGIIGAKVFFFFCDADEDGDLGHLRPFFLFRTAKNLLMGCFSYFFSHAMDFFLDIFGPPRFFLSSFFHVVEWESFCLVSLSNLPFLTLGSCEKKEQNGHSCGGWLEHVFHSVTLEWWSNEADQNYQPAGVLAIHQSTIYLVTPSPLSCCRCCCS